jgi:hypothetical protein
MLIVIAQMEEENSEREQRMKNCELLPRLCEQRNGEY